MEYLIIDYFLENYFTRDRFGNCYWLYPFLNLPCLLYSLCNIDGDMKISDLLKPEFVIPEMKGKTKEDVINELVDLFENDERVNDLNRIRNSVLEREKIMSTGVGKGFAIPHSKTLATSDILVAFGRLSKPIDFEALDGEPVNLVFLLVGKENMVGPHIKLLSRISRMMNKDEFRKSVADAKDTGEILNIFQEEEQKYLDLS